MCRKTNNKNNMINLNYILLQAGGGQWSNIIMMVLVVGVFYFFMIRPQAQKAKKLKEYREKLQKGDKVVTIGGAHGRVVEVNDTTVTLEVDSGVKIKFDKSAISMDSTTQLAAETK